VKSNKPQDFDKIWLELSEKGGEASNFYSDDERYYFIKNKIEQTILEKIIREHEIFLNKRNAVDLGCGTGRLSFFLESIGFDVVGVEWSTNFFKHAIRIKENIKSKVNFLKKDVFEFMQEADQQYEVVITSCLLCNYEDDILDRFFTLLPSITKSESIILIKENLPRRTTTIKTIHDIIENKFRTKQDWERFFKKFNMYGKFLLCDPIFYTFFGKNPLYSKVAHFLIKFDKLIAIPDSFFNKVRSYWIVCKYKQ